MKHVRSIVFHITCLIKSNASKKETKETTKTLINKKYNIVE